MIRISVLRDTALTAGALALTAMAAQELRRPAYPTLGTDAPMPPARHGWLQVLGGTAGDRTRRVRPATAEEAAASEASRQSGDGGWIAVGDDGRILPLDAPAVLAGAGRYTPTGGRIEVAYVDAGVDHATVAAGRATGAIEMVRRRRAAAAALVARVMGTTPTAAPLVGVDALLDEADEVLSQGDVDEDGEQDGRVDHTDIPATTAADDYADSTS
ncbi:hypothetical protein [Frankia sp. AgB32]|uniref:hypothetical protein n=1 Tax=Frankia sp. AgB32 TaxID=631119 RepID=UPI00200E1BA7|nr:hypothetical protein [Frankia sp. AgB32]MCK9895239.1 hypothetical protein [Frankia sp. AgB32]